MFVELFERGFMPIPLQKKSKFPVKECEGFNDWSIHGISESKVEMFEEQYSDHNIGVLLGPASGIMEVDIDTDDPEILAAIPLSPIIRRGRPGRQGRLFKYNPEIKNKNFKIIDDKGVEHGVDILCSRKYIVIPPSIHPDTGKPYVWLTPDSIENFDKKDLPVFTKLDFQKLEQVLLSRQTKNKKLKKESMNGGRNNKIVEIVSAMRSRGESEQAIVSEVFKYDFDNHRPPLFWDSSEGYGASNESEALKNAFKMVVSVTKSILDSSEFKYKSESKPEPIVEIIEEKETNDEFKIPESPGIMKFFVDEIMKRSPRKNHTFATSGALALFSTLCLGRYSFLGMWPNFYILNIGKTSSGKEAPKRFCSEVLKHPLMKQYNLTGLGAHISVPAITTTFPTQRMRLDLLDEYSDFLTLYKSKHNHFARSAAMMLNELWSLNGGFFSGTRAQSRKDETGECWSPGLSLVAMIQNEKFIEIVDEDMLTTGFLSRFLFFSNNDRVKISRDFLEDRVDSSGIEPVIYEIKRFFKNPSVFSDSVIDPKGIGLLRPKPIEITAHKCVIDLINDLSMEFDSKFVDGKDRCSTVFYGKICEHLPKLVTLSAVANERSEAIPDDVDWAWKLLETLNSNSELIITQAIAGSDFEKQLERAINYFRKNKSVSKTRFAKSFKTDSRNRDLIIKELEDRGLISVDRNGSTTYSFNSST